MFKNLPPYARPQMDLPRETRATCSACVMVAVAEWPRDARDPGPFKASLKCCTYEPFIPNFSLGRILAKDPGLKLTGALTPLGLIPQKTSTDFGRDLSSKCAFLTEQATCSIWHDRPSVCRSYFCVSDRGSEGQALWREAERLGNEAEWTLAHELLWDLGFTQDEIDQRTWAEWRGRERELYLETAKRAFDQTRSKP